MRSHVRSFLVLACLAGCAHLQACSTNGSKSSRYAPIKGGSGGGYRPAPAGGGSGDGSGGNDDAGSTDADGGSSSTKGVDVSNVPAFLIGGDTTAAIETLTDTELTTLCANARNYLFDTVSQTEQETLSCYLSDGRAGKDMNDCETRVDQCLALKTTFDPSTTCVLDPLKGRDRFTLDASVPTCTASVAAYVDCITEQVSVLAAQVEYQTCDRSGESDTTSVPQQLTADRTRCNLFFARCPLQD